MRHYVVVFLESRLFPGTWVTDHFIREEPREEIPRLPQGVPFTPSHKEMITILEEWQNVPAPSPSWTLEECILGRVAVLTAAWYSETGLPTRLVEYTLSPAFLFGQPHV